MEQIAKIITIAGVERPDIPYHLATLLSKTGNGNDVLVVDNSKSLELFLSVKSSSGEVARQDQVTYVHDRTLNDEAALNFPYIVCFLGTQPDEDILAVSDAVCIVTDYMIGSNNIAVNYTRMLSDMGYTGMVRLMFLNKASGKFNEHTFMKSLYVKIADPLILWLSDKDMNGLICLEMNGKHKLSQLSAEFKESIIALAEMITQEPRKALVKLSKKI